MTRRTRTLAIAITAAAAVAVVGIAGIAVAAPGPGWESGAQDRATADAPMWRDMERMHGDAERFDEHRARMTDRYPEMEAHMDELGMRPGDKGAMHGDADAMRDHHEQMTERYPEMRDCHEGGGMAGR
jgi:hypothetical protein